ncbi:MauE/DoxX family redox-associated membrane protein [Pedobacter sandarakinus]|uniref:MauE/DoxX family redox-associated membrane protein n=1 Tax=Pedobacter sandarakinus TaxID=353156 RepID=UPI002246B8A1|nr:MauE/DoxX family redox-associated membrane protein [Pedobacter sandarakinus]MCX2573781.1 cation transporter [Pedobacter sandarakinus]
MMTHQYQLTGMTCGGCESAVKSKLLVLPEVTAVEVSKENQAATISMNKHIETAELQRALGGEESKYQISAFLKEQVVDDSQTWISTYKPILLIFGYVTMVSLIVSWQNGSISLMLFMRIFMAGFFLTFSFFKLLNLKAFAESYAMYDVIAKKFGAWGYVYAFIELCLGISFALNLMPALVNWITLIVMFISIIGVIESVLNKKKIQCACLGAVFNLPMSTVTIVEDSVMIAMSAAMLLLM